MRAKSSAILVLMFIVGSMMGCSKQPTGTASPTGGAGAFGSYSATPSQSSITLEQATAFGQSLEAAFEARDKDRINSLVDLRRMVDLALKGINANANLISQLRQGMERKLVEQGGYYGLIAQSDPNARLKFLRVNPANGGFEVVVRVYGEGLNYHRLTLEKEGSAVVAGDAYVLLLGAKFSDTLREAVLPMVRGLLAEKSWFSHVSAEDREYAEHLDEITAFSNSLHGGNPAAAMAAYRKMPESVQRRKPMLISRAQIASSLGEREVEMTVEDFRKYHPNDAAIDLLALDVYLARNEFDEALSAIERIDTAVDGDPYLNVMRAGIEALRPNLDKAQEYANAAIAGEPDNIECHWCVVGIALAAMKHQLVIEKLNQIETEFEIEMGDLRTLPEYENFVNSPEGKKWLADHGK